MSELLDLLLSISVLVVFGIAIFVSSLIVTSFQIATNVNDSSGNPIINQTLLNTGSTVIGVFDANFGFAIIGIGIFLFVTAFLVNSHPVFLPLNIIVYIILIFISGIFSNVFITFAESSAIIGTANNFPTVIFVWRNMPFILTILAGLNLIVMFAKLRTGGGEMI